MVEIAIGACIILVFSVWIHHTFSKLRDDLNILIEESDEETRKYIETKIKQCKPNSKAEKDAPGKEYYYEK